MAAGFHRGQEEIVPKLRTQISDPQDELILDRTGDCCRPVLHDRPYGRSVVGFVVNRFSINLFCKEDRMKLLLAASILVAFAQGALAREPDCRAVDGTSARLACYDAAYPPKLKMPAARPDARSRDAYVDPIASEDARTAAKLKNICRGC